MATPEQTRTSSLNSNTPSPRNFSIPTGAAPKSPVVAPRPLSAEMAAEAISPAPAPPEEKKESNVTIHWPRLRFWKPKDPQIRVQGLPDEPTHRVHWGWPPTPTIRIRGWPKTPTARLHWGWHGHRPPFMSILRKVPVRTPCGLAFIRLLQLLFAGVVMGCLIWNLLYNDFSGYHAVTIALLTVAAWTVFPTYLIVWPLKGLHDVIDPRLTLFADGIACVAWGMTFAAHNAVLWNRETRTKFWATAEGPNGPRPTSTPISTLIMGNLPSISSAVASLVPNPSLTLVNIPSQVTGPNPFEQVGERSLMPHAAFSLDARGTRLGDNGLVSNHDANTSWKLNLIASYFGLGNFILFAFTTIVFAYYYHSALVADTASHLPRGSPINPNAPSKLLQKEKITEADIEANPCTCDDEKPSTPASKHNNFIGNVASSLGTLASPLRKGSKAQPADAVAPPAGRDLAPTNDSGVFGVADAHGVEVKQGQPESSKAAEGRQVFPTHGVAEGWAR